MSVPVHSCHECVRAARTPMPHVNPPCVCVCARLLMAYGNQDTIMQPSPPRTIRFTTAKLTAEQIREFTPLPRRAPSASQAPQPSGHGGGASVDVSIAGTPAAQAATQSLSSTEPAQTRANPLNPMEYSLSSSSAQPEPASGEVCSDLAAACPRSHTHTHHTDACDLRKRTAVRPSLFTRAGLISTHACAGEPPRRHCRV